MSKQSVNEKVGIQKRQRLNRAECRRRARLLGEALDSGVYRGRQREQARLNRNYYTWLAKHGGTRGKVAALLATVLLYTGCGGAVPGVEVDSGVGDQVADTAPIDTLDDSGAPGGDPGAAAAPLASIAHIEQGGTKVAYILAFGANQAQAYVPSAQRYVWIDLATGQYITGALFYTGAGCTGTAYGSSFAGEYGKTVIYANGGYYLVASKSGAVNALSFWMNGNCTNYGGATAISFPTNLQSIARPYDFESIAPLTVKFQ